MTIATLHTRATQSLPGYDLQRYGFASHTDMYVHIRMCMHTVREFTLLWDTARESNYFKKNNGVFTSKVTVSKVSRKWTKALIVRELLTPGLKKWPQVSNDALSLELAATVFHSKLNCQSTVQSSSTINSHLWGKYTEKYYMLAALFQVKLNSSGDGKYVHITEFKDPRGYLYRGNGLFVFFLFLRALSDNFMLTFFLQTVHKHANN